MNRVMRKILFGLSSFVTDLLYRRPYFDAESSQRNKLENEILHLDLVITECCSLKCRDCSNLMQYYKHPENISSDEVISDLKKLTDCVRIRELNVLGGEPFVNQKTLCDVLCFLARECADRVDVINIITNGTIVPGEACINAMKEDNRIRVTLSNYGPLSTRQDELTRSLSDNGIGYQIIDDSFYWLDFGRPVYYSESPEFMNRQYRNCYNRKNCNTLYRGGFYVCPRQAHGIRLGLIPDDRDEYVDLNDSGFKGSEELRRAVISVVRRREHISACGYCINGKYIHVPRAVQEDRSRSLDADI